MKFLIVLCFSLLFGGAALAAPNGETTSLAPTEDLVVIINAENPANKISENDFRDYFFKRKRQWPDGTTVRFLDRTVDVPVRKIFLKNILKKSSEDVDLFWIGQKLYSGDSAPLRETSDAMTVQFVASFKGAIGYVSSSAPLAGKNVKAVKLE